MGLIRDEDNFCRIIGILPVLSSLSFCYHRFVLVLRICNTVLCVFVYTVALPHHFVVFGSVFCKHLCIRTSLHELVPYERRILSKATSQQIFARQKQPTASKQWSRHDGIKRQSLKDTTFPQSWTQ